ncbi:hypothetical protein GCM10027610_043620 [Dactylosporangium cerinum]
MRPVEQSGSVRDVFYDVLRTHGITTIFGNPGSNELPLLKRVPDDFRYVLAMHEGVAVGLADGFAQASGVPSVVNLHAAAGTGNAMGNLTNTQSGHVPVVVTSGQQSRRYAALNALLTNVDAPQLARPLVKWSTEPLRAQDVPLAVSKGILLAAAAPAGPVYVSIPLDDWDHAADPAALRLLTGREVHGTPVAAEGPLRALAERLGTATNPVLVLGSDVDNAAGWAGAVRLADRLRLPVWVAPSPSRCPFPTRHPSFQGLLPAGVGTVADRLAGHDLVRGAAQRGVRRPQTVHRAHGRPGHPGPRPARHGRRRPRHVLRRPGRAGRLAVVVRHRTAPRARRRRRPAADRGAGAPD